LRKPSNRASLTLRGGHRREALLARLDALEVGDRGVPLAVRIRLAHQHQPFRVRVRQRPQQRTVDQRVDNGRGAEAEPQRRDHHQRVAGPQAQAAQCATQILEQGRHGPPHS
jgi:hypothetical protein